MNTPGAIAAIAILTIVSAAQAGEIPLDRAEIENLGIRFVEPVPATGSAGFEATARVVLPPAGDAIVSSMQAGLLSRLLVNVGDEVEAGQVLAELRSPEFISLQRELLETLNAQRLAHNAFERDTQLHQEGIISRRRLQETTTQKAITDAALEEHRQLLRFAGMRDADLRSLEHSQQLQHTLRVRAPFSGVIAERMASTGQRLDAMSPIYRLVDMTEMWLDINVPQERLVAVRPGACVEATGFPGNCQARVTSIGRAVDAATQAAIVRAKLAADAADFRPGQFVAVSVSVDEDDSGTDNAFEVPTQSVTRSGNASFVFVRTATGVAVTQVEVIGVRGGRAHIRGSLNANDAVATSGISALKSMWGAEDAEER
jgi:cobalt-zinc-cadmium efflux system membrane fusion protein